VNWYRDECVNTTHNKFNFKIATLIRFEGCFEQKVEKKNGQYFFSENCVYIIEIHSIRHVADIMRYNVMRYYYFLFSYHNPLIHTPKRRQNGKTKTNEKQKHNFPPVDNFSFILFIYFFFQKLFILSKRVSNAPKPPQFRSKYFTKT